MGLTIHYHLRSGTRSSNAARELVARLRSRAMDLPFERVDEILELSGPQCDYRQYDQDHPSRWLLIQAGEHVKDPQHDGYSYNVAPSQVIAFSTWPGKGCEEANFGLCRYPATIEVDSRQSGQRRQVRTRLRGWSWGSFCKTQYASNPECGGVANFLRCHLLVIAMLDHARSLDILDSVSDEGEFWEKRDVEALAREVGQWNQWIAGWAGQLKEAQGRMVFSELAQFPDFGSLVAKERM